MENATSRPMSLSFSSSGAGWAKAKIHIRKNVFNFSISYLWPGINELFACVYYLYPNWRYDDYNLDAMEYGEADLPGIFDGKEMIMHWEQIPWKTTLDWDGEGECVRWSFERPLNINDDFDVDITLDVHQEEEGKHSYTIRYKDLCYAVSKAISDFIVEYGIIGSFESTWMRDINLRHLLKIKGIALDMPIKNTYDSKDSYTIHTSIEEELKLLLKPM